MCVCVCVSIYVYVCVCVCVCIHTYMHTAKGAARQSVKQYLCCTRNI